MRCRYALPFTLRNLSFGSFSSQSDPRSSRRHDQFGVDRAKRSAARSPAVATWEGPGGAFLGEQRQLRSEGRRCAAKTARGASRRSAATVERRTEEASATPTSGQVSGERSEMRNVARCHLPLCSFLLLDRIGALAIDPDPNLLLIGEKGWSHHPCPHDRIRRARRGSWGQGDLFAPESRGWLGTTVWNEVAPWSQALSEAMKCRYSPSDHARSLLRRGRPEAAAHDHAGSHLGNIRDSSVPGSTPHRRTRFCSYASAAPNNAPVLRWSQSGL